MRHDEERRADHVFVGAIKDRLGDWEALAMKRADDTEFAINRVSRRQQLARRLTPQHITSLRRLDEIRRIGLAAFELRQRDGPGESFQVLT